MIAPDEHRHPRRAPRRGRHPPRSSTPAALGGSIETALLDAVVASATAGYLTSHLNPATIPAGRPSPTLVQQSLVHGYTVGFWWAAGIFAVGALVCGTLLRPGPLYPRQAPPAAPAEPGAVHSGSPPVPLKAH